MKNKTASNWNESIYITESSYYNIEYYGVVEAEFESCYFENVLFYWNILSEIDFKNCSFVDCTFSGVAFLDCMFITCHFKNCEFNQSNVGTECSSTDSLLIACEIDEESSKNNPLTLYVDNKLELLTKSLKKELSEIFKIQRPMLAIDVRGHCLACVETQETHEKLLDLKEVRVNHFQLCYMTVESLSEEAYLYYMPKLLEFLLIGEENEWSSFISFFLSQLIPNKHGDRFKHYTKAQIELIIKVLELYYSKYSRKDEFWDFELDIMVDYSSFKEELKHCTEALEFWKGKL